MWGLALGASFQLLRDRDAGPRSIPMPADNLTRAPWRPRADGLDVGRLPADLDVAAAAARPGRRGRAPSPSSRSSCRIAGDAPEERCGRREGAAAPGRTLTCCSPARAGPAGRRGTSPGSSTSSSTRASRPSGPCSRGSGCLPSLEALDRVNVGRPGDRLPAPQPGRRHRGCSGCRERFTGRLDGPARPPGLDRDRLGDLRGLVTARFAGHQGARQAAASAVGGLRLPRLRRGGRRGF